MTKDIISEYAYEQTIRLAGGESEYSTHTLAMIYAECYKNENIKLLASRYLFGSYEFAERNKARLNDELVSVFGLGEVA